MMSTKYKRQGIGWLQLSLFTLFYITKSQSITLICTSREGNGVNNGASSSISCQTNEVLMSCNFTGSLVGNISIDINNSVCMARSVTTETNIITAVAYCCEINNPVTIQIISITGQYTTATSITGLVISSLCLIITLFITFKFFIVYFQKFSKKSAVNGNVSRRGDNEFGNDTHSSVGSRASGVQTANTGTSDENVHKSKSENVMKVKKIVHCFHSIIFTFGICAISTTILVSTFWLNIYLSIAIISCYHAFTLTHLAFLWYQNNVSFADSKLAVTKTQNVLFMSMYITTLSSCIVAIIITLAPSVISYNFSSVVRILLLCSYSMTFVYTTIMFIFKISKLTVLRLDKSARVDLINVIRKYAFINSLIFISTTSTYSVYVSYAYIAHNSIDSKIILFIFISISCVVNLSCLYFMPRHARSYYNKYCAPYAIMCNCVWFMQIVATKNASSGSSNNNDDVELQSIIYDTFGQLGTVDINSCEEHLMSEQIIFDSLMKIYSANSEIYIDVAGILTMTHLYLTSATQYQLWLELADRTKINEIVDDTAQIDEKLAIQMARNLDLVDEKKMNDSISSYFVDKTAKEIKLQILLNKDQSLLEMFKLDKTYRKQVKKIKFIKIDYFFN
eukprot:195441_1